MISPLAGASLAVAGEAPPDAVTALPALATLETWSATESLSNTDNNSRAPQVVVTEDGTVHIVWEETAEGEIGSLYHTFGSSGAWSSPTEIIGDSPSLATGSAGEVHMAYVSQSGATLDVFYMRWDGSAWTLPVNVSQTSGISSAPAIAYTSGGVLHLIWADNTSGTMALQHGQSSDGVSWSTFPIPNGDGEAPAVAVGPGDVLNVVWQSPDALTGQNDVWYMEYDAGKWSLPEAVSDSPDVNSIAPDVAVDPDGTVHVVWQEAIGTNSAIYHAARSAGTWSSPQDVSGTLASASLPALHINSIGSGFLAWDEGSSIMGRALDVGTGRWLAREEVAVDIFGISDPAVYLRGGTVYAIWAEEVLDPNWGIFYQTRAICMLAEVTGDGVVNVNDVTAVAGDWHASVFDSKHDLDGDGAVTILDLSLVTKMLGTDCS